VGRGEKRRGAVKIVIRPVDVAFSREKPKLLGSEEAALVVQTNDPAGEAQQEWEYPAAVATDPAAVATDPAAAVPDSSIVHQIEPAAASVTEVANQELQRKPKPELKIVVMNSSQSEAFSGSESGEDGSDDEEGDEEGKDSDGSSEGEESDNDEEDGPETKFDPAAVLSTEELQKLKDKWAIFDESGNQDPISYRHFHALLRLIEDTFQPSAIMLEDIAEREKQAQEKEMVFKASAAAGEDQTGIGDHHTGGRFFLENGDTTQIDGVHWAEFLEIAARSRPPMQLSEYFDEEELKNIRNAMYILFVSCSKCWHWSLLLLLLLPLLPLPCPGNIFDSFDRDKSGSVDRDELDQAMDMMGMDIKPSELDLMIAQVDTDGSGTISFDEFLLLYYNQANENKPYAVPLKIMGSFSFETVQEFRKVFQDLDTDNSGTVDVDEIATMFKKLGEKTSRKKIVEMMAEVDTDGSGFIEFQEFLMLMLQIKEGKEGGLGAKFQHAMVSGVIGGMGAMVGKAGHATYAYIYSDYIAAEKQRREKRYNGLWRGLVSNLPSHINARIQASTNRGRAAAAKGT
jgi:Ca2+-binding EF-hand superfamily protein